MSKQDFLQRFLFEERGVRGQWIKLTDSWQAIKQNQRSSKTAQNLLGQALTAVAMLSTTIKFEGSLILQAQGNGAIKTLVAQATHDRKIRGLTRSDDSEPTGSLQDLFGNGQLVITIKPEYADPYQGIVGLEGENLASALETYFIQSEQLRTRLWLFANDTQASGFLLQELPNDKNYPTDWEHIEILANTLTEQELMTLDCEQLLFRLFHEEKIRLFAPEAFSFECVCSRSKIESTLKTLGDQELNSILHDIGHIEVGCEFCNTQYVFDKIDIAQLLLPQDLAQSSTTQH
jgi:molecular chaperone Hsp33